MFQWSDYVELIISTCRLINTLSDMWAPVGILSFAFRPVTTRGHFQSFGSGPGPGLGLGKLVLGLHLQALIFKG